MTAQLWPAIVVYLPRSRAGHWTDTQPGPWQSPQTLAPPWLRYTWTALRVPIILTLVSALAVLSGSPLQMGASLHVIC